MPDETEDLFDSSGESQGYISIEQAGVLANQHAQNNTGSYDTPRLPRLGNRRSGGNRRLLRDKAFFPAHQKFPVPTMPRQNRAALACALATYTALNPANDAPERRHRIGPSETLICDISVPVGCMGVTRVPQVFPPPSAPKSC